MSGIEGYSRIHVIGIAGAGMSALAKLLAQAGHTVTGSDLKPGRASAELSSLGVETWVGHRPEAAAASDLVVASSAVPATDPEIVAAGKAGVEVWERPRLLAEMTAQDPALGVTGTHGKTTATALLVAGLQALGRDPTFVVGGLLGDLNTNAHLGEPGLFVLEADEAFGTFLGLHFAGLVITNIEADHLDYYKSLPRLEDAFAGVASGVDGPVVAGIDDPGALRLAAGIAKVVTYGTAEAADWRIVDVYHRGGAVQFHLDHGGDRVEVAVPRPGLHVARNAAGALALIGELGLDVRAAASGLASFGGVRRRFEVRGKIAGVTVVDDYAHHPSEVAAVIEAARLGTEGRIVAVFQPHRFTRTAEHAGEFGLVLAGADRVFVTDVYSAGEAPVPGVSGQLVADAAAGAGADVAYVPRRADLAETIAAEARPGDLVILMGAGDVTIVAEELAPLLGSLK